MKRVSVVLATAGAMFVMDGHAQSQDEMMALAKKSGCLACHSLDAKMVGPAWRDVAKKYAGDAVAADRLAVVVKKGSKDTWGPVPMPPNATVKNDDIKKLVEFVLGLK